MKYPISLIIFDCDGVLVDSEYLASKISAELITEAGLPITAEEISERYSGMVIKDILQDLEKTTGHHFSISIIDKCYEQFKNRMSTELHAIDGIKKVLSNLDKPFCICSNSNTQDIQYMLDILNLSHFFKGKIFAAPELDNKKLKPAPDVFLHAAAHFNIKPEHCLVIEDSVVGIKAAKAAGMRVVGFTGGSHTYQKHGNVLSEAGAETVYAKHSELQLIINALQDWYDDII